MVAVAAVEDRADQVVPGALGVPGVPVVAARVDADAATGAVDAARDATIATRVTRAIFSNR